MQQKVTLWTFISLFHIRKFTFFFLFRAVPVTHESSGISQAGGQIHAAATHLPHSHRNLRSEPCLQPTPSSWQGQILNPLSKAWDRTYILMTTSPVHNGLTHNGDSQFMYFLKKAWPDQGTRSGGPKNMVPQRQEKSLWLQVTSVLDQV